MGSGRIRPVNVRVVGATNRNLREEVAAGRFREDLYYRLAVVEVQLPPLRERMGDFPMLVEHLLSRAPHNPGVTAVDNTVLDLFNAYHWPGNIRELCNVVERAIPFTDGSSIGLNALPDALRAPSASLQNTGLSPQEAALTPEASQLPFKDAKEKLIQAFERQYLVDLIERHGGNVSKAARAAHMDRKSITRLPKTLHPLSLLRAPRTRPDLP